MNIFWQEGELCIRELVDSFGSWRNDRKLADLVLVEIWIYPDGRSPGKAPQETLGEIIYQKKVPMFYKNLAHYRMRCPICGDVCTCGAYIDLAKI